MKKKLVLSAAAAAMVGTLAVGGTLAWFTDTETATNVVTTGNVNVKIEEDLPSDTGDYTAEKLTNEAGEILGIAYEGIEPGTVIAKNPTITYIGASNGYVRYKVVMEASKGDHEYTEDEIAELANSIKLLAPDENGKLAPIGLELDKYVYPADDKGICTIFENGNTVVENLFTNVEFDATLGNDIADLDITLKVIADAIQSDNLPDINDDAVITSKDVAAAFGEGTIDQYQNDFTVNQ